MVLPAVPNTISIVYMTIPVATILFALYVGHWILRNQGAVRGSKTFLALLVIGAVLWPFVVIVHILTGSPQV
jgi:hypothetical protein